MNAGRPIDRAVEVDAIVIGAGFGGLYSLYKLRELGLSAIALERADDVGGTWYWNRYPGARCDVESMQYSYSFSPELEKDWRWTERYAAQPEILAYANHVADRFDLRGMIRFGVSVTDIIYDQQRRLWTVRTDSGDERVARYCIMATGCMSVVNKPAIPGIEIFRGPVYHTGDWPREPVDLKGLDVAVIGTGSSGIQTIPAIANDAKSVVVFQRTPQYTLPSRNRPLDPAEVADWDANYRRRRAEARAASSGVIYHVADTGAPKSVLDATPEQRDEAFEKQWEVGGAGLVLVFDDLLVSEEANGHAAEFVRRKIARAVNDPKTAAALSPDYPIAVKRLVRDDNYFETFNRENVSLVDLRSDPFDRVTEDGISTRDNQFTFDCIVLATGFDALTGALLAINIVGVDGKTVREKWADGPRNYLGIMLEGFPNLFVVGGPGSPSVRTNFIMAIEQHVEWIIDCIRYMREREIVAIEPRESAEQGWVDHLNELVENTLLVKVDSWYVGANIPGKPRVYMAYAGSVPRYRQICDEIAADGYKGFKLTESISVGGSAA